MAHPVCSKTVYVTLVACRHADKSRDIIACALSVENYMAALDDSTRLDSLYLLHISFFKFFRFFPKAIMLFVNKCQEFFGKIFKKLILLYIKVFYFRNQLGACLCPKEI